MGDKIRLKPNKGVHTTKEREINLPSVESNFSFVETHPHLIVETLEGVNGDIEQYAQHFTGKSHRSIESVLVKTITILARPENAELKKRWDALIVAFKEAKRLVAQNKAMKALASYSLPTRNRKEKGIAKMSVGDYDKLMKMYAGGVIEGEKTKARIHGKKEATGAEVPEADPLDGVLDEMAEDEE